MARSLDTRAPREHRCLQVTKVQDGLLGSLGPRLGSQTDLHSNPASPVGELDQVAHPVYKIIIFSWSYCQV